ncbi:MAG TPA: hypothetical protein VNJ71_13425 [Gemmatimonadales bacterium]|jgi:predicted porin|nr:hypothetical protein [Gemmatimonadales bacterium]
MRRTVSLLAVLLGLVSASRLAAQATGLAVYQGGVAGGLTIGGEVGFPDQDYGEGTAYGARASLGIGPLGIAGLVSRWDPDRPGQSAETGLGGYLSLKVFGGPLIPLSVGLQGGVEYVDRGGNILHFPVGLGFALKIPNPALAIKPWVAPRLDIVRTETGGSTDTDTNFGLSGGVELSLLGGFGFGASYDRVFAGGGTHPSVLSIGAHYTIKIPGL